MGAACVNSARFIGRTTGVRTMFQNNGISGIPRFPDDVDPKIFARGPDHNLPGEITVVRLFEELTFQPNPFDG